MVLETLAHRERATPSQIRRRLRAGELDVPEGVQRVLRSGLTPTFSRPGSFWRNLLRGLGLRPDARTAASDLEETVRFLENELEIKR